MRLLYIVTKGTDDATLASVPLLIAADGSLAIGHEVSVALAGDGRAWWSGRCRTD